MFNLKSEYNPAGDQISAIDKLVNGINNNEKHQCLMGVTGSGKTFTIANVIQRTNKTTLVIAHNKTLAGQLYLELKSLFPENHVDYFVSYYDYYQPEAYIPSSDTYIEKDSSVNDEIDELRHSATAALIENKDVIVVASVSCIYGIGEKQEYIDKMLVLNIGQTISRNKIIENLVNMLYERNNIDFVRGTFRANGDTIEIIPSYQRSHGIRIELFGDEIEKISEFDVLTGAIIKNKKTISIFPASHYVTDSEKLIETTKRIKEELDQRLEYFEKENKLLEKQRLQQRVNYDLEMLKETGMCSGIENYSRHIALKQEGETPTCLMDFFPEDFLLIIDESHVTLPQIRAMYNGDRARKTVLVDYGFRLPSALDNRPLKYEEFNSKLNQVIYVSATPGVEELEKVNNKVVEQIIRPTGLLDPKIEVRKSKDQIDDLINEIRIQVKKNERTLVTTLTKKMAEELTKYLSEINIKVTYLHSEIDTLQRLRIIRELRIGKYDVLVGINLLREGLDLPEVSLVAILDADKQGFLRSERSLIQTIGRCARNSEGRVLMYANEISEAMKIAISETNRRRKIQEEYNLKNNIVPKTIIKEIRDDISSNIETKEEEYKIKNGKEKEKIIIEIEKEMNIAAKELDFERAMELRDILFEIKKD